MATGSTAITISDFLNWVHPQVIAASKSVPDSALYFDSLSQGPSRLLLTNIKPFSAQNLPMLVISGIFVMPLARRTHEAFRKKFKDKIQNKPEHAIDRPILDNSFNFLAAVYKSVDKSVFSVPVIFNSFQLKTIFLAGILGLFNMVAEYATFSAQPIFTGDRLQRFKMPFVVVSSLIASVLNAALYAVSVNGFLVHMGTENRSLMSMLFAGEAIGSIFAIANMLFAFSLFITTFRTNLDLISTRFFNLESNVKLDWFGKKQEEIISSIYKGSTSTSSMFALLNTIFKAVKVSTESALIISGCVSFVTVGFNVLAQHALLSSSGQKTDPLREAKAPLMNQTDMPVKDTTQGKKKQLITDSICQAV